MAVEKLFIDTITLIVFTASPTLYPHSLSPENSDEIVGGVESRDECEHEALDPGGVRRQLQVGGRGGARRVEGVRGHRPGTKKETSTIELLSKNASN